MLIEKSVVVGIGNLALFLFLYSFREQKCQFLENFFVVNITWDETNRTAFFYVDKAFANRVAKDVEEDETLKALLNNLKDEDLDGQGFLIKSIFGQVPGLLENTTELQAGLVLAY